MRASRIINLFTVLIIITLTLTYNSCKKNRDDNNTGSSEEDQIFINNIVALQDKAGENYISWLQTMDSLDVINQLHQFFLADPSVSSSTIGDQGIAVQYSNGMRGGIFLNPDDNFSPDSINNSSFPSIPLSPLSEQSLVNIPKVILLNPHYWERSKFTNDIINKYNQYFPRIGFNLQTVYKDQEASVDRFTQLSGYGFIHIYSHGWAWPKKENIKDIYLKTGERENETTSKKYLSDIKNGNILIKQAKVSSNQLANVYGISEQFIASHNNFNNDTILFYGGFCFSFLGQWSQIENSFAKGAYFGFDWSVYTSKNANWAIDLIDDLTDNEQAEPVNTEEWINGSDPPKSYWYPKDKKTVSIKYIGDPALTLWLGEHCPGIPTFTDPRNGQVYPTVQIGNQCWLKKNMNYQTGNSWCYANNSANCATYGRLYDWETALGVCPSGWHLPTDNEWKILEGTVDSKYGVGNSIWNLDNWRGYDAGYHLKDKTGWLSLGRGPDNGSNAFGFTAIPGGYRSAGGGPFIQIGSHAYFWSSTETTPGNLNAWNRVLKSSSKVGRGGYTKTSGHSVRCLKD